MMRGRTLTRLPRATCHLIEFVAMNAETIFVLVARLSLIMLGRLAPNMKKRKI